MVTFSKSHQSELVTVPEAPALSLSTSTASLPVAVKIKGSLETLLNHPVIKEGLDLLEDLPEDLKFHEKRHTIDVLHEVIVFAHLDECSEDDILRLAIAAVYHDAGYLTTRQNNEGIGAGMAASSLRGNGYPEEFISEVTGMIMDTQVAYNPGLGAIEQNPKSRLGGYLADADLSNLGRPDFAYKGILLFNEMNGASCSSWDDIINHPQGLGFLKSSARLAETKEWYTRSAKELREPLAHWNAEVLRMFVEGYNRN